MNRFFINFHFIFNCHFKLKSQRHYWQSGGNVRLGSSPCASLSRRPSDIQWYVYTQKHNLPSINRLCLSRHLSAARTNIVRHILRQTAPCSCKCLRFNSLASSSSSSTFKSYFIMHTRLDRQTYSDVLRQPLETQTPHRSKHTTRNDVDDGGMQQQQQLASSLDKRT